MRADRRQSVAPDEIGAAGGRVQECLSVRRGPAVLQADASGSVSPGPRSDLGFASGRGCSVAAGRNPSRSCGGHVTNLNRSEPVGCRGSSGCGHALKRYMRPGGHSRDDRSSNARRPGCRGGCRCGRGSHGVGAAPTADDHREAGSKDGGNRGSGKKGHRSAEESSCPEGTGCSSYRQRARDAVRATAAKRKASSTVAPTGGPGRIRARCPSGLRIPRSRHRD